MTKLDAALAAKLCAEAMDDPDRNSDGRAWVAHSAHFALAEQLMAALEVVKEGERFKLDTGVLGDRLMRERDAALREVDQLRKHVQHNDEEYRTMKDVLRAEHQECQRLRGEVERMRQAIDDAARFNEGEAREWVMSEYGTRRAGAADALRNLQRSLSQDKEREDER